MKTGFTARIYTLATAEDTVKAMKADAADTMVKAKDAAITGSMEKAAAEDTVKATKEDAADITAAITEKDAAIKHNGRGHVASGFIPVGRSPRPV